MRADARKRKVLEDAMHQALENHEFIMYLQPKYSISTYKMVGRSSCSLAASREGPNTAQRFHTDI